MSTVRHFCHVRYLFIANGTSKAIWSLNLKIYFFSNEFFDILSLVLNICLSQFLSFFNNTMLKNLFFNFRTNYTFPLHSRLKNYELAFLRNFPSLFDPVLLICSFR